jgi:tetratricopeptide (TPR) repeat protein
VGKSLSAIAVAVNFVNVLKLRSRASMPKATDPPEDLKTVVRRNALRITDASFNDDCKRLTPAIERDSRDSLNVAMFVVLASILVVESIWFAVAKFNFSGRHAALVTPTPSPTATPTTEFTPASTVRPLFFRDAVFYKKCGWNVYQSRHYDKAISHYTEAIRLNPNYVNAHYNRGVAYGNKKDYDKAISDYTQAIRLNPNYANAFNNRGVAYSNKKDYDKAISDFSEYIKLSPNEGDGYYWRGISYRRLGKNVEAQADLNNAKELGYTGPQ